MNEMKKRIVEIAKSKGALIEIAKEIKRQTGATITLPTVAAYLKS